MHMQSVPEALHKVFQTEDYEQMPPMNDFRRTLYWNPNLWTDENGKNITENITKDFVKDVKLLATKGTEGIFTVKMTPTNSAKEEHDLGLNIGLIAKPMAANGNVSDGGIVKDGRAFSLKEKTGADYKEFTYKARFHFVDNMVKKIE